MIKWQTSLSGNIVQFCRYLRHNGFVLSVEEETDMLKALQFIDYSNSNIFKLALRSVFCRSRIQLLEFDSLFNQYWKEIGEAVNAKVKTKTSTSLKPGTRNTSFKSLQSWLKGNSTNEEEQAASYSVHESLSQKDFSSVPAGELNELMESIKYFSKNLATRINRRYKKSDKINLPDLRRTLRKNMRRGGELMEIIYRKPKQNRIKLVILCDVSRSMDLYSAFLLQFMYAFQQVYKRIETFTFSTSLQHITNFLKQNDFSTALRLLSSENQNWSSGTRIGESLSSFVEEYAKRLLDKRTIVVILSDGWDTGNLELLSRNMEIIHTKSKKVIWLNPLAGYVSYLPEVAGMQAALPYIDLLAAVHNAESLRKLGKWL